MPAKLTNEIINAAIVGFEQQKLHIDTQIAELRSLLTGGPAESAATPQLPIGKRKKFSAAARKRMKEAQQRRWAKIRGETAPPAPTPEAPKPKRKLSEAGRAAIVAALKKRWAAKKAAPVTTIKKTVVKKTPVKKAAVKKAPAKAAKKTAPVKKSAATKKTAPAPTQAVPQATGQ
jgi:hypothetical protein